MSNGDFKQWKKYDFTKKTDMEEFDRKSLNHAIDRYEEERFGHILYERKLIESILKSSENFDEEIRSKYANKYEELWREQLDIHQRFIEKNRRDEDEKDEYEIGE